MARKKYIRGPRLYGKMREVKGAFRRIFANARRFCWTHDELLAHRSKLLDGDSVLTSLGFFQSLTTADQCTLLGYWEALTDTLMDELQFRYLINGKWYLPREVCDRKDGTDPARDIPSPCTNGHYVYIIHTENGPEYKQWS